ncbi:MAG: hypothetical protein LC777_17510, partial [Actinobacteria bacterium]|nr:hypothetical protein [Actinomycetota bacterium]
IYTSVREGITMVAQKAAYVVAGAVMGVVATTTVGFVAAGDASSAAQPRKKSTAMVVLSGDGPVLGSVSGAAS